MTNKKPCPIGGSFAPMKFLAAKGIMAFLMMSLLVLQGCGGSDDASQESESTAVDTTPSAPETPSSETDMPSSDSEGQNLTQFAVTVTAAPDFSSGAHSVIDVEPPRMARNNLVPTVSDLSAACEGRFFYRIGRFMSDSITKFDVTQPEQVIYQYSTNDPQDAVSSNPTAIVFVNETKAYVLRYGSNKAWIINPSASTEAEFKIGELDLSAYDEGDGVPEMQDAVVVGDRVFIVMQRLNSFQPTETAYVAVIDVTTDTEIDTDMGGADGLNGIPLQVRNPLSIHHLADNNLVYVQAVGKYEFGSEPAQLTGGIEAIDPQTFATNLVLDDGDDATGAGFGQIQDAALVSATQGYFIGTNGFQDSTLYRFDPSTGDVVTDVNGPQAVGGLFGKNMTDIAVDANGKLWVAVADFSAPGMTVIDTANDSVEESLIGTGLNPGKTVFCEIN